jgi:hypothetical protein
MAVFLLIIILSDVLIDSGRAFLLKVRLTLSTKENPPSIKTSRSMIINKKTAMIVSLTKISCPFNLKKIIFYLRSDGQYILVRYTIVAVLLLLLYCVTF